MESDLKICPVPRDHNGRGVIRNENCGSSSHLSQIDMPSDRNVDTETVPAEVLEAAEEATREIVCRIHPTVVDDRRRKQVIEYVQGLIGQALGYQVFPYGSVPLKTYLPDGDIDLTVISSPNFEDALVSEVRAVLKKEELNQDASYEVKDVQFIDAEVKLVKFIVQNIVVDISFNQLGGLSTLCFLEKVDQIVGKNHLFKRSIILIKAWCYYESRILGAHHGLISTYALETLILYIFHVFHHNLNGPLAVLYRFLDYFSKFDWDNYAISLNGLVCKSSLQAVPIGSTVDLLFSDVFLSECVHMFTVPSRKLETFPQKHLNIIDPLKENNNLGRSVNRGNFYRIRSAFKYGARKLSQILVLPKEKIADDLNNFFANTLVRHGSDHLSEVQNSAVECGGHISDNDPSSSSVSSLSEVCFEENVQQLHLINGSPTASYYGRWSSQFPHPKLIEESQIVVNGISSKEMVANFTSSYEFKRRLLIETKESSSMNNDAGCPSYGEKLTAPVVPANSSLVDDVTDNHLPAVLGDGEIFNLSDDSQSLRTFLDLTGDYDIHLQSLEYVKHYHFYAIAAPVMRYSPVIQSQMNNHPGSVSQSFHVPQHGYSQVNVNGVFMPQHYYMNHSLPFFGSEEKRTRRGTGTYIPNLNYHTSDREKLFSPRREKNQSPRNHGQWHRQTQDNISNGQLQRHAKDHGTNGQLYRHGHDNGANGQQYRHVHDTGSNGYTYRHAQNDGSNFHSHRRAQDNESNGQLHRHDQNKSLYRTPQVVTLTSEHVHELSEAEYPYLGNGKSVSPPPPRSPYPLMWGSQNVKGSSCASEKIDLESNGHKQQERPLPDGSGSSLDPCALDASRSEVMKHSCEQVAEDRRERMEEQTYNLKDEDFPPLSH